MATNNISQNWLRWREYLWLALTGAIASLAFLPVDLCNNALAFLASLIPLLALYPLLRRWVYEVRPRHAAKQGFAFGCGLFFAGMHWVIIAMTSFGGMPWVIAIPLLLLLLAYLSAFIAATGWCAVRFFTPRARLLALPALWAAFELLRTWLFGGMPWLILGTSQAAPSLFAGLVPVGGVCLASFCVVALICSRIGYFDTTSALAAVSLRKQNIVGGALVVLALGSAWIPWTQPQGEPLSVSLVQGNIAQDIKFVPELRDATYRHYYELAAKSHGKLVLLPESAFPDFLDNVPEKDFKAYLNLALTHKADFLIGAFTRFPNPNRAHDDYHNSIVSIGESPMQIYRKRHLVLFGEKIPFEDYVAPVMNSLIAIPLAGQSEGAADQPPFQVAGQSVAVSICFEDVFGSEQIVRVRQSTLLANFTNDAWYAHSIAAWQHHRIASLRSLESGRPMLRVTNTGITAIIDHHGHTVKRIPWFETGVLEGEIVGRSGSTPYLLWGDYFVCLLIVLVLIFSGYCSISCSRASQ